MNLKKGEGEIKVIFFAPDLITKLQIKVNYLLT